MNGSLMVRSEIKILNKLKQKSGFNVLQLSIFIVAHHDDFWVDSSGIVALPFCYCKLNYCCTLEVDINGRKIIVLWVKLIRTSIQHIDVFLPNTAVFYSAHYIQLMAMISNVFYLFRL